MIIQHNMAAMYTNRQLGINNNSKSKSANKLSSGYRINVAADDAAGLQISEKMRGQIRGLTQASRNIQDGMSYVQVADGALDEVQSIFQRIRELAVQAANDTNTAEDRLAIDEEVQELKQEANRIFTDTEFNARPIWDVDTDNKVQVGTERKPAVTMPYQSSFTSFSKLNNTNKYQIADTNGYIIEASDTGMKIKWTDYYGEEHESNEISWPVMDGTYENGDKYYTSKVSSFSTTLKENLNDEDKKIGVDFDIKFGITEGATIEDLKNSLNGRVWYRDVPEAMSGQTNTSEVWYSAGELNYEAILALDSGNNGGNTIPGIDFTAADTDCLKPTNTTSNLKEPYATTGNWTFEFENPNNPGVKIEAKSTGYVSWTCNNREADAEGTWWHWVRPTNSSPYKSGNTYSTNQGSAKASIDYVLENTNGNNLIADDNGYAGYITIRFDLTSAGLPIEKEDGSSTGKSVTNLGYFNLRVAVGANETADSVRQRVAQLTHLDLSTNYSNAQTGERFNGAGTVMIDSPLWKATNEINIQCGANTDQKITLGYDALRTYTMGIEDTNVLTRDDAGAAITEIDEAIQIVSDQRSYFGACQNRMEHAQSNADNTAENVQASESRIRDVDMADEMVGYSRSSILEQAAQAMLAQANGSTQGILQLLQ